MRSTQDADLRAPRCAVLPPKALLLSLLGQAPLIAWCWPLSPTLAGWVAGALVIGLGIALNLWSDALFRRDGVGVCPFSPAPRLIAGGPFRFTRNPMYLGLVMISAGMPLISGVPANLLAPVAYAIWLHFRFVLPEEEFLHAGLGKAYDAYRVQTPRWVGFGAALRRRPQPR